MDPDKTAERGYDRVSLPLGRIMLNNFLGGLAWGFGTVVGATLLVAIAIWIIAQSGALTGLTNSLQNTFTDTFQKSVNSLQVPSR